MADILISQLCKDFDGTIFDKLPKSDRDLFITYSYVCLVQKLGNQKMARQILIHTGEIESYTYDNNVYTIYKKDSLLSSHDSLKRVGVTSVKVLEKSEIQHYRDEFRKTMRGFPEYKRDASNPDLDAAGNTLVYVLGGFGAFGNPASFHNMFVRNLRLRTKKSVLPLFADCDTNFEMLIDRMMFRNESQAPSAESWHRDVVPPTKIEDRDEIYGGWVNLDSKSQFFSCIPGSHLGVSLKLLKKGFASIPAEHMNHLRLYKKLYEVPPGHVIIFPQYIIHEVVSKKADRDMMRMFTGWRTTVSTTFLHADMRERLKYQAIIPLPSGQLPPLYSANHASFLKHKPFKPIPKNTAKVTVDTWFHDSIKDVFIVQRFMESLKTSGLEMYVPYSEKEIQEYLHKKI